MMKSEDEMKKVKLSTYKEEIGYIKTVLAKTCKTCTFGREHLEGGMTCEQDSEMLFATRPTALCKNWDTY